MFPKRCSGEEGCTEGGILPAGSTDGEAAPGVGAEVASPRSPPGKGAALQREQLSTA